MTRTTPGAVLGTAGYMSPEQVRGEAVDARSDIFSFGLVLYECLAGRPPFERPTGVELMTAILREDPPELPETVAPALRQIVSHCLEKEPGRRFDSARDLAFALRTVNLSATGSRTSASAPALRGRRRRWLWPAVSLRTGRAAGRSCHSTLLGAGPYRPRRLPLHTVCQRSRARRRGRLEPGRQEHRLPQDHRGRAATHGARARFRDPHPADEIGRSRVARLLVAGFDADLLHHPRRRWRIARYQPLGRQLQAHHGPFAQRRNLARRQNPGHLARHRISRAAAKHGVALFASGGRAPALSAGSLRGAPRSPGQRPALFTGWKFDPADHQRGDSADLAATFSRIQGSPAASVRQNRIQLHTARRLAAGQPPRDHLICHRRWTAGALAGRSAARKAAQTHGQHLGGGGPFLVPGRRAPGVHFGQPKTTT